MAKIKSFRRVLGKRFSIPHYRSSTSNRSFCAENCWKAFRFVFLLFSLWLQHYLKYLFNSFFFLLQEKDRKNKCGAGERICFLPFFLFHAWSNLKIWPWIWEEICVVFMLPHIYWRWKNSSLEFLQKRGWKKFWLGKKLFFSGLCFLRIEKIEKSRWTYLCSEKFWRISVPSNSLEFQTLPLHLKKGWTLSIRKLLWKINKLELVSLSHLWFFTVKTSCSASIPWIFHFSPQSHLLKAFVFQCAFGCCRANGK